MDAFYIIEKLLEIVSVWSFFVDEIIEFAKAIETPDRSNTFKFPFALFETSASVIRVNLSWFERQLLKLDFVLSHRQIVLNFFIICVLLLDAQRRRSAFIIKYLDILYSWPLFDPEIAIIVLELVVVISYMILNVFDCVVLDFGSEIVLQYFGFVWLLTVEIVPRILIEIHSVQLINII